MYICITIKIKKMAKATMSKIVQVRVKQEDFKLFEELCKIKGVTASKLLRGFILKKIEKEKKLLS